ncbi:MAG: helix-turn-helix domain-containing protein, partial [Muribaculaceae bacterium]|nr:helix-turn-helix domain-containing protein [Muribaculaceae bacterium]
VEYMIGETFFRPNLSSITYKGETHNLSVRQTEILQLLAENQGKLVERDKILEQVWGDASYANSLALNVQITYIRRLLSDPSLSIISLKKKGYILRCDKE